MERAASVPGAILPSLSGGVQTAICGHLTSLASTAVMTTVETRGTLPPGI